MLYSAQDQLRTVGDCCFFPFFERDRQRGRQTDTDRQTDRQTERKKERKKEEGRKKEERRKEGERETEIKERKKEINQQCHVSPILNLSLALTCAQQNTESTEVSPGLGIPWPPPLATLPFGHLETVALMYYVTYSVHCSIQKRHGLVGSLTTICPFHF